jgi:hypothetical protein
VARGTAVPAPRGCSATSHPRRQPPFRRPRHVLRRALARPPTWVHLLHPPRDRVLPAQASDQGQAGRARAGRRRRLLRPRPQGTAHDFRRAAITMLESMGISVEFSHHEGAPRAERDRPALCRCPLDGRQHHDLPHRGQGGRAEQGIYASFMPKPFREHPGSGMHTHLSLFEGDTNAFFEAGALPALQDRAAVHRRSAAHGAEITAVTNQWVNSYKRLWGGGEAPAYLTWGHNNRSALVRVPMYKPDKGNSPASRCARSTRPATPTSRTPCSRRRPQGDRGGLRVAARGRGRRVEPHRRRAPRHRASSRCPRRCTKSWSAASSSPRPSASTSSTSSCATSAPSGRTTADLEPQDAPARRVPTAARRDRGPRRHRRGPHRRPTADGGRAGRPRRRRWRPRSSSPRTSSGEDAVRTRLSGHRDGQERRSRAQLHLRRRRHLRRRAGRGRRRGGGDLADRDQDLATRLMSVCSAGRTAATGALWEVDAALRPEGKQGQLVRTVASHRSYYERWAKTWEFQALLKARPWSRVTPRWGRPTRRRCSRWSGKASSREDFVADVQAMRRRVEQHIPPAEAARQLKLGAGGLRDVEFSVQLLQLVHGRARRVAAHRDHARRARGPVGRWLRGARGRRDARHGIPAAAHAGTPHPALPPAPHPPHAHRSPDLRRLGRALGHRSSPADAVIAQWKAQQREVRRLHERIFYHPLLSAVARLSDSEVRLTPEAARGASVRVGFPRSRMARSATSKP